MPAPSPESIFDGHVDAEFVQKNADPAIKTMTEARPAYSPVY
jgi:hypothetical protein